MAKQPQKAKEAPKAESAEVAVTNNYTSALSVFGVTIEKGESKEVPNFNAKHGVVAKWIEDKVILVK